MKIAFLGNFGADFSSESHHKKTLENLGHEVIALQEVETTGERVLEVAEASDALVWVHTHGWDTPGLRMAQVLSTLKDKGIPTLTYHLDLWFGLQRQRDMQSDDYWNIGHFFTVDKKMADWFNEETSVKGHYMPAAVYDVECYWNPAPPERDLIFVGSRGYHPEWPYRPQLIDWLGSNYGHRFTHFGGDGAGVMRGADLNRLYASTKVAIGDTLCINFDYPYYFSDRVFETLGRGGFIIHPRIKGIEDIFEDKKHLVLYDYGDFDQLKREIDFYLEADELREEIRKAGHEHVKKNHTYLNRWTSILESL